MQAIAYVSVDAQQRMRGVLQLTPAEGQGGVYLDSHLRLRPSALPPNLPSAATGPSAEDAETAEAVSSGEGGAGQGEGGVEEGETKEKVPVALVVPAGRQAWMQHVAQVLQPTAPHAGVHHLQSLYCS